MVFNVERLQKKTSVDPRATDPSPGDSICAKCYCCDGGRQRSDGRTASEGQAATSKFGVSNDRILEVEVETRKDATYVNPDLFFIFFFIITLYSLIKNQ